MTRDPWKLVTSVDELRAGPCVELRPDMASGRVNRFILISRETAPSFCHTGGDRDDHHCRGWKTTAHRNFYCGRPIAIPERRLYALIDDDTAADETTVTRRRELVE